MNNKSENAQETNGPGISGLQPVTWFRRGLVGLAGGLMILSGVGAGYQVFASRRDRRRILPPGQLIDAGGFRLHLSVAGKELDGPVVILDGGLGVPSTYMTLLQSALAPFTRVVAYDRPGIGWSEPRPAGQPYDALGNARALHTALANAGIPGPYVLVGHSAGGINMIVFAATYPDDTGGLVLLDSTHPDQFQRYPPEQAKSKRWMARLATILTLAARLGILRLVDGPHLLDADELKPEPRAALQAYFASPKLGAGMKAEIAAWDDLTFPQARGVRDLGDIPLVVLTAGTSAAQAPVQIELHDELAALSTNSVHRVVEGASHASLVSHSEYLPDVAGAIRQVVDAVRTGLPLDNRQNTTS